MKTINLTDEEIHIISAALNNDAIAYKETAEEDYDLKDEYTANYDVRMELKDRFDDLVLGKKIKYVLRDMNDGMPCAFVSARIPWTRLQNYICSYVEEYDHRESFGYDGSDNIEEFVVWRLEKWAEVIPYEEPELECGLDDYVDDGAALPSVLF